MRESLRSFVREHDRIFVLTGAGVSTASGIPDYRDADGRWKRSPPMQYGEFVRDPAARRRYWARSLVGWRRFAAAEPGPAHRALARMERMGKVHHVVTQNVDGLHQQAGSRRVLDLHGRLDRVVCLGCGEMRDRERVQQEMASENPGFAGLDAGTAPDGDADLTAVDFDAFRPPHCEACGDVLKPWVVFFGESVPRARVRQAFDLLKESDAVLVVGSSLMIWSGYRFVRQAVADGKPVAAVNLGRTRAEEELRFRIPEDCGSALTWLVERGLEFRFPAG